MTRLHEAIRVGETNTAIALINEGADLNTPTNGYTPLHLAIANGRTAIALKLIAEKANLETRHDGWTLLNRAIIYGRTEIALKLIEEGVDLNALSHGSTPLCDVFLNNSNTIAFKLIEKGADRETPIQGWTPLHRAIYFGNIPIACELILKGVNINAQTADTEETPLHLAARKAPVSKELIKLLLNASPDMTLKDSKGVSVREAIQKSPKAEEAYDEYCAELSKMAIFSAHILESKGIPLEISNHIVKLALRQHGLYFSTKAQSDAKAHMVTGVVGRILEKRKNERANNVAQSEPQNESRTAPSEGTLHLRSSAQLHKVMKSSLTKR